MKNRWAMLLAVLLIPVWATAQNAANSSFQIKGILLDSLTKEGEPYATIKIGTFIKYYKISQLIHTQIIAN